MYNKLIRTINDKVRSYLPGQAIFYNMFGQPASSNETNLYLSKLYGRMSYYNLKHKPQHHDVAEGEGPSTFEPPATKGLKTSIPAGIT
jgi:hypothetical protein